MVEDLGRHDVYSMVILGFREPLVLLSLFTAAKLAHLNHLLQGQPESQTRTRAVVEQMAAEGFGGCANTYGCEAACPKDISVDFISEMNRDYRLAILRGA